MRMLLLLPLAAALASPPPPLTLEEACSKAERVVVGVLEDGKEEAAQPPRNEVRVIAGLRVKETLYGQSSEALLPVLWHRWKPLKGDEPPPAGWEGSLFEGRSGKELIYCLRWDARFKGWIATHPQEVMALDLRAEVGKALQARLAPLVRVLEASDVLSGWAHIEGTPADTKACLDLAQAGPAAIPAARGLMKHKNAVQRAWGCRLAGLLKDKALRPDLEALLRDDAGLEALEGCVPGATTVAEQARLVLGRKRNSSLCPACSGNGIRHYLAACRACGRAEKGDYCCAGPHARVQLCEDCARAKGVCLGCGKPLTPSSP